MLIVRPEAPPANKATKKVTKYPATYRPAVWLYIVVP